MSDAFRAVHPALVGALERQGFVSLTPVQRAVLDRAKDAPNLRITSQTGSGKTIALGMVLGPDLVELAAQRARGPAALVVAPTRELAAQVGRELSALYTDVAHLFVTVITGGTDPSRERKQLAKGPLVVVGTPGRLLDHTRGGVLDLSGVRHVVLDEADQMLDMGFRDELDAIVEALPAERRAHLVSATFPKEVKAFADRFQPNALHVEGTRLGEANADISHVAHLVHEMDRYPALVNVLLAAEEARTLVFVARRADAAEIAEMLAEDGFSALPFSGDLSQVQRTRTLAAFRNGIVKTLVATDVAARGIDVQDIATVVHHTLPIDAEVYTHRSGRTGRAGQQGRSVVIVAPRDEKKARWIFRTARVEPDWARAPSAKKIHRANQKRTRSALQERLASSEDLGEAALGRAEKLLEEHDPSRLVATLVEMAQRTLPRDPMTVRTYEPRGDMKVEPRPRVGAGPRRGRRDGRRTPRGSGRKGGPRGRRRGPR